MLRIHVKIYNSCLLLDKEFDLRTNNSFCYKQLEEMAVSLNLMETRVEKVNLLDKGLSKFLLVMGSRNCLFHCREAFCSVKLLEKREFVEEDLELRAKMLFKEKKFNEAHDLYCTLVFKTSDVKFQLNSALCSLKAKHYQRCVDQCTQILKTNRNQKAIYRRALGNMYLNHKNEAKKDLEELKRHFTESIEHKKLYSILHLRIVPSNEVEYKKSPRTQSPVTSS